MAVALSKLARRIEAIETASAAPLDGLSEEQHRQIEELRREGRTVILSRGKDGSTIVISLYEDDANL